MSHTKNYHHETIENAVKDRSFMKEAMIETLNRMAAAVPGQHTVKIGTIQEKGKHYEYPYFLVKSVEDMGKLVAKFTVEYDECNVDHDGEYFEIGLENTVLKNLPIKKTLKRLGK
jgi:CYTH domain-containing protein